MWNKLSTNVTELLSYRLIDYQMKKETKKMEVGEN